MLFAPARPLPRKLEWRQSSRLLRWPFAPASAPTPDRASGASDLRANPPPIGNAGRDLSPEAFPESPASSAAAWHSLAAPTLGRVREWRGKLLPRSEEHTSELQSQ